MLVDDSILRQVVRLSPIKVTLPFAVEVLPLIVKNPSGSVLPSVVKLCTWESEVMTVPVVGVPPPCVPPPGVSPVSPPVLPPGLSPPPGVGVGVGIGVTTASGSTAVMVRPEILASLNLPLPTSK